MKKEKASKDTVYLCQYIKTDHGCEGVCTNPNGDTILKQCGRNALLSTCRSYSEHPLFDETLVHKQDHNLRCCYRPGRPT